MLNVHNCQKQKYTLCWSHKCRSLNFVWSFTKRPYEIIMRTTKNGSLEIVGVITVGCYMTWWKNSKNWFTSQTDIWTLTTPTTTLATFQPVTLGYHACVWSFQWNFLIRNGLSITCVGVGKCLPYFLCYWNKSWHYNDIIMWAMESKITGISIVYTTVASGTEKKKTSNPLRHWPLCREFTSDPWIPRTNGQ